MDFMNANDVPEDQLRVILAEAQKQEVPLSDVYEVWVQYDAGWAEFKISSEDKRIIRWPCH